MSKLCTIRFRIWLKKKNRFLSAIGRSASVVDAYSVEPFTLHVSMYRRRRTFYVYRWPTSVVCLVTCFFRRCRWEKSIIILQWCAFLSNTRWPSSLFTCFRNEHKQLSTAFSVTLLHTRRFFLGTQNDYCRKIRINLRPSCTDYWPIITVGIFVRLTNKLRSAQNCCVILFFGRHWRLKTSINHCRLVLLTVCHVMLNMLVN